MRVVITSFYHVYIYAWMTDDYHNSIQIFEWFYLATWYIDIISWYIIANYSILQCFFLPGAAWGHKTVWITWDSAYTNWHTECTDCPTLQSQHHCIIQPFPCKRILYSKIFKMYCTVLYETCLEQIYPSSKTRPEGFS